MTPVDDEDPFATIIREALDRFVKRRGGINKMRGSIDPADEPKIRKDGTCIPWEELQNIPARLSDLVKYERASLRAAAWSNVCAPE